MNACTRLAKPDVIRQRPQLVALTADEATDAEADERAAGDSSLPFESLHGLFSSMGRVGCSRSRAC
jgi:hypothetical protein